jgi:hypothetical protein
MGLFPKISTPPLHPDKIPRKVRPPAPPPLSAPRKDPTYRSERSRGWVKKKSPDASAATREAEEALS